MGFSGLSIGMSGLQTYEKVLDVIGHNLANASTEGYSRQQAVITPAYPQRYTYGVMGRGVIVNNVVQFVDSFADNQLRSNSSTLEDWQVQKDVLGRLESIINELSEGGLSNVLNDFWNGVQDVIDNVEDVSTRTSFIQEAQSLAESLNSLSFTMEDLRASLNERVQLAVGEVNGLASEIARYNKEITRLEFGGAVAQKANDLRDQRELAIKKLSGLMNVTVIGHANGSVTITNRGLPLVEHNLVRPLSTTQGVNNEMVVDTVVFQDDQALVSLNAGTLGGLVEARDDILVRYMADINDLAANMLYEINKIHSQGSGIERYTSITSEHAVLDPALAFNDTNFEMNFTPRTGTFNPQNGSFVVQVRNKNTGEIVNTNINVDLDGIAVPADTSLNSLSADINAVANITASVDPQNRLTIQAANGYDISFADDTSGMLATLGIGGLFTGFDANSIGVRQELLSQPMLLAAAQSDAIGDNTNFYDLFDLRNAKTMLNGTATFDEFYGGLIGELGVESRDATTSVTLNEQIQVELIGKREEVSGVSSDEEVIKMIAAQRAYQACAKFISVMDSILDTLVNRT